MCRQERKRGNRIEEREKGKEEIGDRR